MSRTHIVSIGRWYATLILIPSGNYLSLNGRFVPLPSPHIRDAIRQMQRRARRLAWSAYQPIEYPQGWRYYPGDTCQHGVYVGGCGEDLMCAACEGGY